MCVWKEDVDGAWDTACQQRWEFFADGPKENGVKYCPFCGDEVEPSPYVEEPVDEEDDA